MKMPYIERVKRVEFNPLIDDLVAHQPNDGEVNYIITKLLYSLYGSSPSYQSLNRAIGILECVKLELWGRILRPYEDDKIRINGDVYENSLPTERNLAWAAGFFEGEGCFYAGYYKPRDDGNRIFRTHASVAQKDIGLLYQFKNIVGFGVITNDSKNCKSWKTTKVGEASKILEWFRPWLSKRRIERAEKLLREENLQILRPLSEKCPKGHFYTPRNTIVYNGRSGRICKICRKEYAMAWRAKQVAGYWRKYIH